MWRPVLVIALACALAHRAAGQSCPDAGVECRLPISGVETSGYKRGCEINGVFKSSAAVIGGKCFEEKSGGSEQNYYVVGTTEVGQCYVMWQNGCQPNNCPANTPTRRCNERIAACKEQPRAAPQSISPVMSAPSVPAPSAGGPCAKCNIPEAQGGCKCDDMCDCKASGRKLAGIAIFGSDGAPARELLASGDGLCTGVKISG